MQVMREEGKKVFLEDGGRAGQGMPCLPQLKEKLFSQRSGGVGGGGRTVEEEKGGREGELRSLL